MAFETVGEDLNFSRPPAQPYHWKFGGGVRVFLKLLEFPKKIRNFSKSCSKVAFCKKTKQNKNKTKQNKTFCVALLSLFGLMQKYAN